MSQRDTEIVITGVNGFVGGHVARHLFELGYQAIGVGREATPNPTVEKYITDYRQADLIDEEQVAALPLKTARAIIHLAGLASVADSFKNPELYRTGNATMTKNLLSSALDQGFAGRALVISTGAVYDTSQETRLNEDSPLQENSPYAYGKVRAEEVAEEYRSKGMDVVTVRPFNHIGPGQGIGFLVPDLYEQLVEARKEGRSEIQVGNLSTKRDYTDVRDIVRAYRLLATSPSLDNNIYNVSSGSALSGFEILDHLRRAMGLASIDPVVDPKRVRPTDSPFIIGDSSRIKTELGWKTLYSPERAIRDFVQLKTIYPE